jgi:hypothetical protein
MANVPRIDSVGRVTCIVNQCCLAKIYFGQVIFYTHLILFDIQTLRWTAWRKFKNRAKLQKWELSKVRYSASERVA